jgi:hypothetical protein
VPSSKAATLVRNRWEAAISGVALIYALLRTGRLVRDPQGQLQRLSGSAARGRFCQECWRKAGIQPPAPHDLRRTSTGDLLEAGVDLATVR